ncbi:Zn-ribbon domain-containing OB-fold protein [Desulfovirgula thermocuniculi]|uniref:Zn-ribbon domain-containing OB-fold protein n=1 Tax=Desulfovirgula thermocuniculi TaxID=348842 RepID=UPI0004111250|nr:Zn-ribbon domain-containing OB-fold protein [Desulfovirgula thermocuniculi]
MGAHISIPMYQRAIPQRYRLVGQKCVKCGKVNFPPKAVCKYCLSSAEFAPVKLSGRGTVYSYTVIAGGGAPPEFAEIARCKGRYPVALVQLEEGPVIIAQLVDVPEEEEIFIGMPVEAVFRKIYEEEGVIRYGIKFRPA